MQATDNSPALAVDVAILPPPPVRQQLAELNRQMLAPPSGFRFGPTCLPHLTLAQQLVRSERVGALAEALGSLLEPEGPLELMTTTVAVPHFSATLGIAPSAALTGLHRRIMDLLVPFQTDDDGHDAFIIDKDGEPPRPSDLEWVRAFRRRSAYESFDPHITLGVGAVGDLAPFAFVGDTVELYHLGRFCTCRAVLASWTLTAQSR